jgi:NAD(P)-dependent dehydrogenase (short-subunit alcohol dehydrogenase family)
VSRSVAIVTGAARGIGAATALEFARRGYDLAITDILPKELADVAKEITDCGARTFVRDGDLADLRFAEQFIAGAAEELGRIDVLVNNAAWRELLTMREMTVDSWERTMRVCLTAPAFLSRWAGAVMERQGGGVIVNVSSIMSRQSWGMSPAYVAAKGGLEALTHDLAALYGPAGVRVVSVSPGAVDTETGVASNDVRAWSEEMISLRRRR